MPMFVIRRQGPQDEEPDTAAVPDVEGPELLRRDGALKHGYILHRLQEALDLARTYGRPLAIIVAEPAVLPGEHPTSRSLAAICEMAHKIMRSTDLVGWLDSGTLLIILRESEEVARAVASRFRQQMWLATRGVGGQKWRSEVLEMSPEFASAEQFIEAARAQQTPIVYDSTLQPLEMRGVFVVQSGPVGGVAELPDDGTALLEAADASGTNVGVLTAIATAVGTAALALVGAAWYARRRLHRS
jgi:hypothetical protein